jgi:hypothetical protein
LKRFFVADRDLEDRTRSTLNTCLPPLQAKHNGQLNQICNAVENLLDEKAAGKKRAARKRLVFAINK